ncbi:MAG: flavodoxin domain-containing protein, partial [Actinomycetota bacterium]
VTAASRHEATREIARGIAETFKGRGVHVDFEEMDDVRSLDGYDGVVIGSAVYAGRWLKEAKAFVKDHAAELAPRRVWLFSSGPIGQPPVPIEEAPDAAKMLAISGAEEHHTFAGRLTREGLSVPERAIVRALHVEEGDFRDWTEIEAWAERIAEDLARVA